MPSVSSKTQFLMQIDANDCVKDKITGRYPSKKNSEMSQTLRKARKGTQEKSQNKKPLMTRVERKKKYQELKKDLKEIYTTEMETTEEDGKDVMHVPSHYKKYTLQDRKIIAKNLLGNYLHRASPMKGLKTLKR
ncbi:hypothetical protein [Enterobacter cloacae complex sp. GF14B]|uniref:hypothetical protein n=1 Tax=Enterobacter cloacae complex sp. GF14B TaxID=2511982 RepID=UPI001026F5D1|nr:hypothetical protein [Enterobacter cloacae complex sp. GF14B]RYA42777.1 hypothetical protein DD606_25415 [Enterobacter cloacae complex sp. GF14B]